MGRKKAVDLFPEYARSKRADTEALSQLVLAAKGNMTMKKFANKCGVNTSTISRIINMKTETVCSDEIILEFPRMRCRRVELHLKICLQLTD